MSAVMVDPSRAPVAYGLRAVPRLFTELQSPDTEAQKRALNSLSDLLHDPERLYQTVTGGFLAELRPLLQSPESSVRTKTCELLYLLTAHNIARGALLSSALLAPLSRLLDDSCVSVRINVHRVFNRLALLPSGAEALQSLVPKLMLKLRQIDREKELRKELRKDPGHKEEAVKEEKEADEDPGHKEVKEEEGTKDSTQDTKKTGGADEDEEEELVLLLSTLTSCCLLDALPALASDGVTLLKHKLSHPSTRVRREASSAIMALSVPVEGKRRLVSEGVLTLLKELLSDSDLDVRTHTVGAIMYCSVITPGKTQSIELGLISDLLKIICEDLHPEPDQNQTSPEPDQDQTSPEPDQDQLSPEPNLGQTSPEPNQDQLRDPAEDPVLTPVVPPAFDPVFDPAPPSRRALVLYSLRALTALSEAPVARTLLMRQRHLLEPLRYDPDPDVVRAADTALSVVNWTPAEY